MFVHYIYLFIVTFLYYIVHIYIYIYLKYTLYIIYRMRIINGKTQVGPCREKSRSHKLLGLRRRVLPHEIPSPTASYFSVATRRKCLRKGDPASHNITFYPRLTLLTRARALRCPHSSQPATYTPLVKISLLSLPLFPLAPERQIGQTNNMRLPSRISQSGREDRTGTEARSSNRSK